MDVNVSQHVRLCLRIALFVFCLNGWLGFGVFGSNMGELPSPEIHVWKSMFFPVVCLRGRISFFGNEVLVLSERSWAILGVRVPGSMGGGLGIG